MAKKVVISFIYLFLIIQTAGGCHSASGRRIPTVGGNVQGPSPQRGGIVQNSNGSMIGGPNLGNMCIRDDDCGQDMYCENQICTEGPILKSIEQGNVSISAVRVALRHLPTCIELPGLNRTLVVLKENPAAKEKWMEQLFRIEPASGSGANAYSVWLQLIDRYQEKCGGAHELSQISSGASIESEHSIDDYLKSGNCEKLQTTNRLRLWPYESRFASEALRRDFSAAEVTRRVWLDTLKTFERNCGTNFSRRDLMQIQMQEEKLMQIIGLNDNVLIDLRDKMLSALEAGDPNAVVSWSKAIAEREKVLDVRNSEIYEARIRDIETDLLAQRQQQSTPHHNATTSQQPSGSNNGIGKLEKVDKVLETTEKTIDTVNKGVDTTKKILRLFGI
ncbi:MAG: hypothetical protein JXX14_15640 [Deltaproteobacteria bacterium]|nr:hypothetical protein [Deltaproteobacteria bacterium]